MRVSRGFTLIELLVVIAIIGIFSCVQLANLTAARNRGADAAIRADLSDARTQAQLYRDANAGSYARMCEQTGTGSVRTIYASLLAAQRAYAGNDAIEGAFTAASAPLSTNCRATTTVWAAEVPLRAGGYFCVDSSGESTTTAQSTLGAADAACN